jgi:hypothetical protein
MGLTHLEVNFFMFSHIVSCHSYSKKGGGGGKDRSLQKSIPENARKLPWDEIEMINEDWENTEQTSAMWVIISQARWNELLNILQEYPEIAHIRSEDGRGPMWWAHEHGRPRMVQALKELGVSEDRSDVNGVKPTDISKLRK